MLSAFILSVLSYPAMHLATQQVHHWNVLPNPLVLRKHPLKYPTPTEDRDQPGSRRFKPSSRTTLIGEQPNPWELLHPRDAMNRHRGAKPERRCELLTPISLLSPFARASKVRIVPLQILGLSVDRRWSFDRNFHRCVRDHADAHLE